MLCLFLPVHPTNKHAHKLHTVQNCRKKQQTPLQVPGVSYPCWTRRSQVLGVHSRKCSRLDGIFVKQKLHLEGNKCKPDGVGRTREKLPRGGPSAAEHRGEEQKPSTYLLGSRGGSFWSPLPDVAELYLELQLALVAFPLAPLYIPDVFICVPCAPVAALAQRKPVRFLTAKGEAVVLQSSWLWAAFQVLQEQTHVRPERSSEPRPAWLAAAVFLTLHGPSVPETTQPQRGTWPAENFTASLLRAASFRTDSCPEHVKISVSLVSLPGILLTAPAEKQSIVFLFF